MSIRNNVLPIQIQTCLMIAGIFGFACSSWTVFWITAFLLLSVGPKFENISFSKQTINNHDSETPRRTSERRDR